MSQDLNLSILPSTVPLPPREHKLRQRGSSAEGLSLCPDEVLCELSWTRGNSS